MAKKTFSSFITDLHESDTPPVDTDATSMAVMSLNYEDSVLEITPLNPAEQQELTALETVIKTGLDTFLQVGSALLEIRQKKLYRGSHLSIKAYVADRFGLGRQRAYQLMDAAQVVQDLSDDHAGNVTYDYEADSSADLNTHSLVLPEKESHASALAEIAPEKRRKVWDEVVRQQQVTGKSITARKILATAETIGASLAKEAPNEPKTPKKSKNNASLIKQAYITQLQNAAPTHQPGDLMVRISGRFLLRNNLVEAWQALRGMDQEIDESFYDFISLQEANVYKLL
ncbi:hypothetical protein [Spirosoma agri]|uniref:DUF3102 domain-containing protein n=1 Tax=Spirosoma agri TaxID=1987381 RepID=A0A6M0IQR0_9BACT|nr:hypothetical protein [Spirosoma agri]NEU70649.1 hypothetical protein [Spirosoma agri]